MGKEHGVQRERDQGWDREGVKSRSLESVIRDTGQSMSGSEQRVGVRKVCSGHFAVRGYGSHVKSGSGVRSG